MPDIQSILSQHFLLCQLSKADLDYMASLATTKTYKKGEPIFLKGDPGTSMMALMDGCVRICAYSFEGREVVLNVIGPGEIFGEIAFIDGGERTADAFAMEPSTLLIVSRRDFLPFLERNPQVCIKLLEVMCHRIRWTTEQVEQFTFHDLPSRLAKKLLHLADVHGEETPGGSRIGLRLSQQMLAGMIGTSREAVNKQLRSWEAKGIIAKKRGSITVVEPDRLLELTEDS